MFIKYLLLLFIVSNVVFAENISVTTPFNSYLLDYSASGVVLESAHYKFKINNRKCIAASIYDFSSAVSKLLRSNPLDSFKGDKPIVVQYKEKKYYTYKGTKLANGLLNIPNEVRRLKIDEKISCK